MARKIKIESPIKVKYAEVQQQCSHKSILQPYTNRFPLRPTVNMALIILITFQVYLVVSSKIYLRDSLIRSFLQLYAQDDRYPQLYAGNAYYIQITNISQIQQNLEYTFEQIRQVQSSSFLKLDLKHTTITLSIQYINNLHSKDRQSQYIIDPKKGIVQPFDMSNITSLQKFLIQVNWFKIILQNVTVEANGFYQKYSHQINYDFQDGLQILIDFDFAIDNSMINTISMEKPQTNYLIVLRVFYVLILGLALTSIYLNYNYIRRTMKVVFHELGQHNMQAQIVSINLISSQDISQINQTVLKWIQVNKLTLQRLTFKHYFYIIQFDILFSIVSNLFTVIGSFYLFIGFQREIIIGISCLTSWMTIFKFLKNRKGIVLMYELIKLGLVKVLFFFVEFSPVFLAYTLLGICLFPKVIFFSSLSRSVTTLVSLMLGDSISEITQAIIQKNSVIAAILYIFTYVLMFMHAIHNTLTALIKEAFIIKKIDLINQQKKRRKQTQYLYISELKCKADEEKQHLPILLTESLKKDLLRINHLKRSNYIQEAIKKWFRQWEKMFYHEKWQAEEDNLININFQHQFREELQRRSKLLNQTIHFLFNKNKQTAKISSLLTEN